MSCFNLSLVFRLLPQRSSIVGQSASVNSVLRTPICTPEGTWTPTPFGSRSLVCRVCQFRHRCKVTEPPKGFEPPTYWLQISRSTNWTTVACCGTVVCPAIGYMLYSANMSKNKSFLKGTFLTFVSKWYSLSVFEYNKKTSFFVKNIKKNRWYFCIPPILSVYQWYA